MPFSEPSAMPETTDQKFQLFKKALKDEFGTDRFNSWFARLDYLGEKEGLVILATDKTIAARRIREKFMGPMQRIWTDMFGDSTRLTVGTRSEMASRLTEKTEPSVHFHQDLSTRKTTGRKAAGGNPYIASINGMATAAASLDPELRFESFCVGDANRMAYTAARAIVEDQADKLAFFHGLSSRGKTHLLNAIGHAWQDLNPGHEVLYITQDKLLNDFVSAVLAKNLTEFRAFLDRYDVLLIDDIHLLRGRKATQSELLTLIDRAKAAGKTIVVAGSHSPARLAETGLQPRLADRLAGGLCLSLEKADFALRLAILNSLVDRYAQLTPMTLTPEASAFIARKCHDSVRQLIGAFGTVRVHAMAMIARGDAAHFAEADVEEILKDLLRDCRNQQPSLDDIKSKAAEIFGTTTREMEGRRRLQGIVKARHAYNFIAKELTDAPLKQIGAVICRDHTTIISSIERAKDLAATDAAFADRLTRLMEFFEKG